MTTILFDLDGTLIDSTSVVLPVFRKTLESFGLPIPDDATLKSTFGMPDEDIWKMLMPDADSDTRNAAFAKAEHDIASGMFQTNILLPSAREVLVALYSRGHILTTASNCGTAYLNAVLDSQDIRSFFSTPLCLEAVGGSTKADILTTHFLHFDKSTAVMIGDRASDVHAAHHHGVPVVGCQLGFGSEDELTEADVIVTDLRHLLPLFPAGSPHLVPHRRR